MFVYVLSKEGKPLMPTTPARARKKLRDGKAKVVQRTPFTIQLTYETTEFTQPITLGVDAGSKKVGISAATETTELYAAEAILRDDIVDLLSDKRMYRRNRRNRKTRYRKARFKNRRKGDGWLAPSIRHKIDSHIRLVRDVHKILPISKIIVEVAAFDMQKINNPDIDGKGYQEGDQLGFWNVREYVLFRDGHMCHGKKGCKGKVLNVHHIESRKTGGDAPNNLITLCEDCHKAYHAGTLEHKFKRGQSFRDAAFMGIMRWALYNKLKGMYGNVSITYGYLTKHTRITNDIEKTHASDAYCITGNVQAKRIGTCYMQKFVRKNNRSLHKATIAKGGIRKANKAPYIVHGFRLFDKVLYKGQECFIFGRRASGYFDLRKIDGTKVHASAKVRDLKLLAVSSTLLCG